MRWAGSRHEGCCGFSGSRGDDATKNMMGITVSYEIYDDPDSALRIARMLSICTHDDQEGMWHKVLLQVRCWGNILETSVRKSKGRGSTIKYPASSSSSSSASINSESHEWKRST